MKFLLMFLLSTVWLSACGQTERSLKLPKPSDKLLLAKDTAQDIGYLYLLGNWKITKPKAVIKKFVDCEMSNCDCQWNIKFENNIYYEFENCGEHGIGVGITFPNTKKDEVVKLINALFKNSENIWKENFTKYEPKESGDAGCYYEIIEKGNSITLEYYCGC